MNAKFKKAKKIIKTLNTNGYEAVVVGGAVRDYLMGKEPYDFDIATNATPDTVEKLFKNTINVGKQFGVILVISGQDQFEIATFRKDIGYSDGRRPDKVEFANAKADVLRRDFTINGIFWHPQTDKIIDYTEGQKDIEKKIIRSIGSADKRFEEDKLRILRAIRFASNLNFTIEKKTWTAIKSGKYSLKQVSIERIQIELEKILIRPNTSKGLELIKEANFDIDLLNIIFFPKAQSLPKELKRIYHHKNPIPIAESLSKLYLCSKALFKIKNNKLTVSQNTSSLLNELNNHLKKMKFPNKTINKTIKTLKTIASLLNEKSPTKAFLRQILGTEHGKLAHSLLKEYSNTERIQIEIIKKLEETKEIYNDKSLLPSPLITGAELFKIGLKSGPDFAIILKEAYQAQLNNDKLTQKEILAKIKENEKKSR